MFCRCAQGIELDLDADALPEGASALWDKINVFESVSLATWARQARLFGSGVVWQLSTVELELCDHQVGVQACPHTHTHTHSDL